jgi:serine phosphatase RsbU (regulator of sigma subunit)
VVGDDRLEPLDSALLETLLLQAPVAFAFYDTQLRYRRINRLLAEINGLPMDAHIGYRPSEVLPPEIGPAIESMLLRVLDSGEAVADDDFTVDSLLEGPPRHFQSQWFPAVDETGAIIGVAVLIVDVTERRRIEDALRLSRDRTAQLQLATAALASALSTDDVRRIVDELCGSAVAAVETQVLLMDARPPTAAVPVSEPVRSAREFLLPLRVSGRRIGSLRLVLRGDQLRDPEELSFLEALAGQCAIALERARLYERERDTAVALQQSLLPAELPNAPGVELAARFRPATGESEVGGDWYDAFQLRDGRLVLVVGDVMGKGVVAAAGMGRLRAAVRALAFVNPLPEAVLQGLDRVFSATEGTDQIATLVYLLVNPEARRVAVGGAGHLPLVLLRPGSNPELIDAGSGSTPLGWPELRAQRTLELGPGDILLGLTDGVVERRGFDLDTGLDEVLASVAEPARDLDELVERVADRMLGHTAGRDDATLLAIRFE